MIFTWHPLNQFVRRQIRCIGIWAALVVAASPVTADEAVEVNEVVWQSVSHGDAQVQTPRLNLRFAASRSARFASVAGRSAQHQRHDQ